MRRGCKRAGSVQSRGEKAQASLIVCINNCWSGGSKEGGARLFSPVPSESKQAIDTN